MVVFPLQKQDTDAAFLLGIWSGGGEDRSNQLVLSQPLGPKSSLAWAPLGENLLPLAH